MTLLYPTHSFLGRFSHTELVALGCLLREVTACRRVRRAARIRGKIRAFAKRPRPRTATTWAEGPSVDTPVAPPFGPGVRVDPAAESAPRVSYATAWGLLPEGLGEDVP